MSVSDMMQQQLPIRVEEQYNAIAVSAPRRSISQWRYRRRILNYRQMAQTGLMATENDSLNRRGE